MKILDNYAFIDGNNLHLGVQNLGWELDYQKFRIYLKDKYKIGRAFYFIGDIPANKWLYDLLTKFGYEVM